MENIAQRDFSYLNNNYRTFNNIIDSFFDDLVGKRNLYSESLRIDISEEKDKYLVEAEIPGFSKDDIKIEAYDGKLILSVEKCENKDNSIEEKNYIHRERKTSNLSRIMYFKDMDEDKIKANLEDGILKINIYKKEIQDRKKIEIE